MDQLGCNHFGELVKIHSTFCHYFSFLFNGYQKGALRYQKWLKGGGSLEGLNIAKGIEEYSMAKETEAKISRGGDNE